MIYKTEHPNKPIEPNTLYGKTVIINQINNKLKQEIQIFKLTDTFFENLISEYGSGGIQIPQASRGVSTNTERE